MSADEKNAELVAEAVARMGALPVPVGPGPQRLNDERRERYAAALFEFVNGAYQWSECEEPGAWLDEAGAAMAVADAELARLRKDRDAFRDQRNGVFETNRKLLAEREEEQMARLRAENETRTVRCEADALQARVAELEAQLERVKDTGARLGSALAARTEDLMAAEESTDKLTRLLAPVASLREDPHDSPLHHDYRVPHDLPETGGGA